MSDCINHQGALNTSGYGWVSFKGKQMAASRKAWIITNGEIPTGLCVLHRCNNRKCVNIEHLYIGNHSRNMRDRAMSCNQNNGKLTPEKVKQIRSEYQKGGVTQTELARRNGLSTGYISQLVKGMYWKDVK